MDSKIAGISLTPAMAVTRAFEIAFSRDLPFCLRLRNCSYYENKCEYGEVAGAMPASIRRLPVSGVKSC
jgi:hypothetical protein